MDLSGPKEGPARLKELVAMEIRQEQSLKLLQKLVLTPQLQMAIRLLQLSRMELVEEVRQQLESNPVLEEDGIDEQTLSYDDPTREVSEGEPSVAPPRSEPEEAVGEEADRRQSSQDQEVQWEQFVEDYGRFSSGPQVRVSNEEYPSVEATVSRKGNLTDHLLWQLQLSDLREADREIGAFLVGNLNEDGFLKDLTVEEAAARLGVPEERVRGVLRRIQTFDPVGVGARDLQECLLIQARTHHPGNERLQLLLERFLPDLERRNFSAIARGLRCSLDEVKALVETVCRMDPRPGRAFNQDDIVYVQPDVYVFRVGDEYVTVLNEDGLPRLRISAYYESVLSGQSHGEARDFVQDKLRSAMWLIRSIQQRQSTIRKVTESIMRFQRDFLDHGVTHLRPLVLRDVAEDVGMHESTISRVTSNKYVHTPRGIFELKYFFNSRIGSVQGEDQASEAVKAQIKAIVEAEDPRSPLSDQDIVERLRAVNVVIARRTVAKYREALGILPSSRRRALV